MPGVGAYLVLPDRRAAAQASLMCSGVSKSGSPAAKPQTSSPAACRALAFASTARVGDGEMLRDQTERGAGAVLIERLKKEGERGRGDGERAQKIPARNRRGSVKLICGSSWPAGPRRRRGPIRRR